HVVRQLLNTIAVYTPIFQGIVRACRRDIWLSIRGDALNWPTVDSIINSGWTADVVNGRKDDVEITCMRDAVIVVGGLQRNRYDSVDSPTVRESVSSDHFAFLVHLNQYCARAVRKRGTYSTPRKVWLCEPKSAIQSPFGNLSTDPQ